MGEEAGSIVADQAGSKATGQAEKVALGEPRVQSSFVTPAKKVGLHYTSLQCNNISQFRYPVSRYCSMQIFTASHYFSL